MQYRSSQKQYELVNRPWLVFKKTNMHIDSHFIIWSIENIGNIPAKDIEITSNYVLMKNDHVDIHEKGKGKIKTDIIMPKQKFTFTLNSITFEDLEQPDSIDVNIFIKYKFLNHKKTAQFRFYRHNGVDHENIHCVNAD